MTSSGRAALAALGVDVPDADTVRCCVDWTEQRPHISGPHGRAVLHRLLTLDWVRRAPHSRAVLVTDDGRRHLVDLLGVDVPR